MQAEQRRVAWRVACQRVLVERKKAQALLRTAQDELSRATLKLEQLQQHREHWLQLKGTVCPTCSQKVRTETAVQMTANVDVDARVVMVERKSARVKVRKAHARVEAVADLPLEQEEPLLDALQEAYARASSEWQVAEVERRSAEVHKQQASKHLRALTRDQAADAATVQTLTSEVERLKAEHASKAQDVSAHAFWVHGFSNAGLKSYLIETKIPSINAAATAYAHRLLGPGSFVRLSATRRLKDGDEREQMSVDAFIPGCSVTYAKASKGQRRRMDLCLLLAFRDIIEGFNGQRGVPFMVDELFDGLDATGEEFIVELLRDLAKTRPVFLVTHSDTLRAVGDRVVTVRREDFISKVEVVSTSGLVATA